MTINLDLAQFMPVLPAVLGLLVAGAVELVTKAAAPAPLKRAVAAGLALLAGVIPTITIGAHQDPRAYVGAVLSAWVVALTAHAAGLTGWVQSATAGFGVGPADPVPADGTAGMAAGAPGAGEQSQEWAQLPADDPAPAPAPAAVPSAPASVTPFAHLHE